MALLVWTSSYRSTQQIREESAQVRAHLREPQGAAPGRGEADDNSSAKAD